MTSCGRSVSEFVVDNSRIDELVKHRKPVSLGIRPRVMYLVRFACCYLTMEFILHYMYMVAIKDRKAWVGASPAEIAMIGFWNLMIIWLKVITLSFIAPLFFIIICPAPNSLAVLPRMGTFGWHRPTGKYGQMHGE